MAEEEEGKEKDPENPEQQQNADDICDFTVFIIKEDRSALVYECSSLDSEVFFFFLIIIKQFLVKC